MSKFDVVRRCYNCGDILQGDDPKKEGYIDKRMLDTPLSSVLFCEKCWADQKYNISPKTPKASKDVLTMLEDAQATDALIIYVVDLFSFEASFIPEINEAIAGLKILVVANKRDLLPLKADEEYLREYVAHRFRVAKLACQKEDVVLTSLTSNQDIMPIVEKIDNLRRGHDVYCLAATGAGKTLLLYSFLRGYSNSTNTPVQTVAYPGTHLSVLTIPLDRSSFVYELPGTSIDNSILSKLDMASLGEVTPTSPIKGKSFYLSEGDCLYFGGLAYVEMLKGSEKTPIHCYFSPKVEIMKKHNSSSFFKMLEKGELRPSIKGVSSSLDFDAFEIEVEEKGSRDIGIEGLGWFSFEGNGEKFRIFLPKGVSVYTSRAKIKEKE